MAREQAVPGNPWVAVRPGDDVALLARRLSSAHQSFIDARGVPGQGLTDDSHVRSVVLEVLDAEPQQGGKSRCGRQP